MENNKQKTNWVSIYIDQSNVLRETEKAVLFELPKEHEYAGMKFWNPSKLCSKTKSLRNTAIRVSFPEGGNIDLFKDEYNKETKESKILEEKTITAEIMKQTFDTMHDKKKDKEFEKDLGIEEENNKTNRSKEFSNF